MNSPDDSKKFTFGLLCDVSFLDALKRLVEMRPENAILSEEVKSLVGKNYRVKIDKQVVLEPKSDDQDA